MLRVINLKLMNARCCFAEEERAFSTYTPKQIKVTIIVLAVRFDYENKEYDSDLGTYDFHFRQYKPEWGLFTQPDTLIQNVYDPQMLNHYAFERNSPYNYIDPDGHNPFVIGAILGFVSGALYYEFKHPMSNDEIAQASLGQLANRAVNRVAHGLIGAAAGAATAGVFFTPAGRVVAQKGIVPAISIAGKTFAIGASESILHQSLEGEGLNFDDALVSGGLNIIPSGATPKGGTFYSVAQFTKNSRIFGTNYLVGQLISYAPDLVSYVSNKMSQADEAKGKTSKNKNGGGNSGGSTGGYTPQPWQDYTPAKPNYSPSNGCGVYMSCA